MMLKWNFQEKRWTIHCNDEELEKKTWKIDVDQNQIESSFRSNTWSSEEEEEGEEEQVDKNEKKW